MSLFDFLQGASNAAASNVSGPIDLLGAGLRFVGVPVPENALLGSKWMEEKGLTRKPKNALAGLLGEAAGLSAPIAAAAKAPQIAAGLLSLDDKAMDMARRAVEGQMVRSGGMQYALQPLKPGAHYAVNDLSQYSDKLYRQTSIDDAERFIPGSQSAGSPMDAWLASEPTYALGQGGNKGALLEFDAKGFPGQLSMRKPAADLAYSKGNAEFISRELDPAAVAKNLRSITVDAGADPRYMRRVEALANQLGWKRTVTAEGQTVYAP